MAKIACDMRKKIKRTIVYIASVSCVLFMMHVAICIMVPVTMVPVSSDIKFTNVYAPDAYLCLPAAYTSLNGEIEGQYRIDSRNHGKKSLKEYTSIHPTKGLVVGNKWYSDNGFQQHVLVKNYKARKFKDKRKRYRRALCCETSDSPSYLIIESTYPMTLSDFAQEVSHYWYNAVNLDMGHYGYRWIGKSKHTRWAKYNRDKQTSWIVCEKQ